MLGKHVLCVHTQHTAAQRAQASKAHLDVEQQRSSTTTTDFIRTALHGLYHAGCDG